MPGLSWPSLLPGALSCVCNSDLLYGNILGNGSILALRFMGGTTDV
jgi:hypothetical protein